MGAFVDRAAVPVAGCARDRTPDHVPDRKPDLAPDRVHDFAPDRKRNVALDLAPDLKPDPKPDRKPNVGPNLVPDRAPDITPNFVPDRVPDRASAALASLVVSSLLDEACLAPKPGLVDSRGNGSHADLDLALMQRSALALAPAFTAMAAAGAAAGAPTIALRETLGRLGRDAEQTMMATTGGVNTHRGAIWALGLLVAAAAIDPGDVDSARTAARAGAIARHRDRGAPSFTGHKGEQACRTFEVVGARGQARNGFPHVTRCGLPELRRSRARGDGETSARLNALLAIMSRLDDTCVLARGGLEALQAVQRGAAAVLAAGGAGSLNGRRALRRLAAEAVARGVSPGGAADLLAATLFLDRLESTPGTTCARQPIGSLV